MDLEKLRNLVQIMETIEDNPEGFPEDAFEQAYPDDYIFFSQFCLGGKEPYATDHGGILKLTQEGIRKLNELKEKLYLLESQKRQESINKLIALTGSTIASVTAFKFLTEYDIKFFGKEDTFGLTVFTLFIAVLLMFILAETWKLIKPSIDNHIRKIKNILKLKDFKKNLKSKK